MDANKKIDRVNPQCPNESKILGDILNNHPIRLSLAGSAFVSWIYIQQLWHSLKLDDSKDNFKFFLDTKELQFSLDDLRRIFQLPQAIDNNNVGFVAALSFSQMLPFFQNDLGFYTSLTPSHSYRVQGLSTNRGALCKMLNHSSHRVENDEVVKLTFNFGKNKEGDGMKIPDWMLTEEMKHTAHYQMYATVFQVDVSTTQSQPIESTQGTHRTPSAPMTPNLLLLNKNQVLHANC
ncbi:hypothetical protein Tco_0655123 [Tanacetum coccineum]|uniref:Uncharacterized protein n=1 Tax=Tanacetum coccineum TaxID=301880 RepID=A0ABQ4X582_9ASTR